MLVMLTANFLNCRKLFHACHEEEIATIVGVSNRGSVA